MPEPGARKRILIDDESLLDLFEQSGEQASDVDASPSPCTDSAEPASADDRGAFRFLLALILIRKRLLVCERTGKDGTMFVRPRSSPKSSEGGTLSQVRDPGLSEGSITRVVGQLSALLEGDLAAPPSTPPPPPATSSAPSSGATA
jgi:hypothetical protein